MTYEVELKFPCVLNGGEEQVRLVKSHLEELAAQRGDPLAQQDCYFSHPARDFASTDEALRVRSLGKDGQNTLTYKGPLVDAQTKTRREIEVGLQDGRLARQHAVEILEALGFRLVAQVVKTRVPYHMVWEGRDVELSIDNVDQLGEFIEIETLAEDAERDAARDGLIRLATRLGLKKSERRSYLGLLLERIHA